MIARLSSQLLATDAVVPAGGQSHEACLQVWPGVSVEPGVRHHPHVLALAPGLVSLGNGPGLLESWAVVPNHPQARYRGLAVLENADTLFLAWHGSDADLERATREAYMDVFAALQHFGFAYLLRVWNFFSDIHGQAGAGLDRYQAFCAGRARALEQYAQPWHAMPAATAIGTATPGLWVYAIAAREPGVAIENPRQVSAYHYPRLYSPDRPAFARATRVDTEQGPCLLLSGTASIVGHASRHYGDVRAQTHEILANLEALRQAAGSDISALAWLRVYVRHPEDQPAIAAVLSGHYRSLPPTQWVYGEVCRPELLVEIEGVHA